MVLSLHNFKGGGGKPCYSRARDHLQTIIYDIFISWCRGQLYTIPKFAPLLICETLGFCQFLIFSLSKFYFSDLCAFQGHVLDVKTSNRSSTFPSCHAWMFSFPQISLYILLFWNLPKFAQQSLVLNSQTCCTQALSQIFGIIPGS